MTSYLKSLDGALNNSKSLNGKVTVFCNGNETSNSFVVSGYDTSGVYQTDTITGVNGATATGSISFNEILSISVANNTASTIKIGTQATQVVMDPQVVTITPAGSDVGELYTITGLDQFGKTQTEVMTAQSAGTTVIGENIYCVLFYCLYNLNFSFIGKHGCKRLYEFDYLNLMLIQ